MDGTKFWWLLWFPAKKNSYQLIWAPLYTYVHNFCISPKLLQWIQHVFSFLSASFINAQVFCYSLLRISQLYLYYLLSSGFIASRNLESLCLIFIFQMTNLNEPYTIIFNFYVCFIFRYLFFHRHMKLKIPEAHIFSYIILVLNVDFEGM